MKKDNQILSIGYRILHLTYSRATVAVANIVVLMVASRYLSLHDYATFRQTFLPYDVLSPILSLGIPATIYYSLSRRLDRWGLIIHAIIIMTCISLGFCGFITFGGAEYLAQIFNNPDLKESMEWLAIYPFFQIPISLFLSVYIYEGKAKFVGIYSTVFAMVFLSTSILLLLFFRNYIDIVKLKVILPILGCAFLFIYTFNFFYDNHVKSPPIFTSLLDVLKTSIPFGIASMIGGLSLQIDKILVSSLGSTQEFAIYVNGAMEIPLIGILTGSVSVVLIGEMSRKIKEKKYAEALALFRVSANNTALIIFPVMIFFLYNAKEFMILLFSERFVLSAFPFIIYLFLLPIRIVVFGAIFIAMGKSHIILYRSIVEVILNCILSIAMYKLFGYLGVAVATVLVTYIWSVPYNIMKISHEFSVENKELFDLKALMVIGLISLCVSPVMMFSNMVSMYYLKIALSFSVYTVAVLMAYKRFGFDSVSFGSDSKSIST